MRRRLVLLRSRPEGGARLPHGPAGRGPWGPALRGSREGVDEDLEKIRHALRSRRGATAAAPSHRRARSGPAGGRSAARSATRRRSVRAPAGEYPAPGARIRRRASDSSQATGTPILCEPLARFPRRSSTFPRPGGPSTRPPSSRSRPSKRSAIRPGSKRSASRIPRMKRKSLRRTASVSFGYQRGWARTSARNAKWGATTAGSSRSPERSSYRSQKWWNSSAKGPEKPPVVRNAKKTKFIDSDATSSAGSPKAPRLRSRTREIDAGLERGCSRDGNLRGSFADARPGCEGGTSTRAPDSRPRTGAGRRRTGTASGRNPRCPRCILPSRRVAQAAPMPARVGDRLSVDLGQIVGERGEPAPRSSSSSLPSPRCDRSRLRRARLRELRQQEDLAASPRLIAGPPFRKAPTSTARTCRGSVA